MAVAGAQELAEDAATVGARAGEPPPAAPDLALDNDAAGAAVRGPAPDEDPTRRLEGDERKAECAQRGLRAAAGRAGAVEVEAALVGDAPVGGIGGSRLVAQLEPDD